MGLTGIILDVRLRLKKIHTAYIRQRQVKAPTSKKLDLFEEYAGYTYSAAWIDCLQTGKGFGRSILSWANTPRQQKCRVRG